MSTHGSRWRLRASSPRPFRCCSPSAGSSPLLLFAYLQATAGWPAVFRSRTGRQLELFQNLYLSASKVRLCRYRRMNARDNAVTEASEMLFGDARSTGGPVSFDRYRDRCQNGNPRTIQHEVDIIFSLAERNDKRRTPAYTEPPNSGPGGQSPSRTFCTPVIPTTSLAGRLGLNGGPIPCRTRTSSCGRNRRQPDTGGAVVAHRAGNIVLPDEEIPPGLGKSGGIAAS